MEFLRDVEHEGIGGVGRKPRACARQLPSVYLPLSHFRRRRSLLFRFLLGL